ncbi:MAG TPA: flagellar export chaperone FliS [Desulfobacterales bacterium]|nr:flagellar export chaperone FliS [Desulfobacterales bacterium]
MINNAIDAYNRTTVAANINKEDILLKLYDGVIRFISFAQKAAEEGNIPRKGEFISRSLAIITELDNALDRKNGGVIADNLSFIYFYVTRLLTDANIGNNPKPLQEARELLDGLLDSWHKAVRQKTVSECDPTKADKIQSNGMINVA